MTDLGQLFRIVIERRATDMHLSVDHPPLMRKDGDLVEMPFPKMSHFEIEQMIFSIVTEVQKMTFQKKGELDFGYTHQNACRFRINVFREKGNIAAAFRLIPVAIPTLEQIGMPNIIESILDKIAGLILVTGPTGCGKSTTLAAMINYLNKKVSKHVVTIEDPIEYIFPRTKCKFSQREIGRDTEDFSTALKYILRQDPDIILIGEMRDPETIMAAITCTETGHLVLSTLHTIDTVQTVDRIVDSFPGYQQNQVRFQVSMLLQSIISQRLLKRESGGLIAAREVLIANDAVRNIIREQKTQQLYTIIQTSSKDGMVSMDAAIMALYRSGVIAKETALGSLKNKDEFNKTIINARPFGM